VSPPIRHLSAAAARRFLVERHLLAQPRALPAEPASVMRVVDRLGSLQFDPLEVAGRNHDLTLLARIEGYQRGWTDDLLYRDRALYETYNKMLSLVPTAELPWYRITWDLAHEEHRGGAFDDHAPLVEELLERVKADGPLSSTDIEPRAAIDWYWRPTNQVRALLEALAEAGILAIVRREGNRRVYDLTERLLPPELLAVHPAPRDQYRHKLRSRYRGNGLLGATGDATLWSGTGDPALRRELRAELIDAGELTPVEVEGLRGERFVMTAELPILRAVAATLDGDEARPAPPGVAFIAPLDPLVWDRDLLARLWSFHYRWEVYVPAAKRRWGYYVLPVLYGDRFVGRIEPRIDRASRTLRVIGLWWEPGFDPLGDETFAPAFAAALAAHRDFAGLTRVAMPTAVRHRPLARAVRLGLRAPQRMSLVESRPDEGPVGLRPGQAAASASGAGLRRLA
jgi:uncharacterized protein YcaQ